MPHDVDLTGLMEWLITQPGWEHLTVELAEIAYGELTPEQQTGIQTGFTRGQDPTFIGERLPDTITLGEGEQAQQVDVDWQLLTTYINSQGQTQEVFIPIMSTDDYTNVAFISAMQEVYGDSWKEVLNNVNYGKMEQAGKYLSVSSTLFREQGINPMAIGDNMVLDAFVKDWANRLGTMSIDEGENAINAATAFDIFRFIPSNSLLSSAGIDLNRLLDPGRASNTELQLGREIQGWIMRWGMDMQNPDFMRDYEARTGQSWHITAFKRLSEFIAKSDVSSALSLAALYNPHVPGTTDAEKFQANKAAKIAILGGLAPTDTFDTDILIDPVKLQAWIAQEEAAGRVPLGQLSKVEHSARAIAEEQLKLRKGEPAEGRAQLFNRIFSEVFWTELEKIRGLRASTGEILDIEGIRALKQAIGGRVLHPVTVGGTTLPFGTPFEEAQKVEKERLSEEERFKSLSERARAASAAPRKTIQF